MFKTNHTVPESGVYRVIHASHRLPHEVTLLKGNSFPRCAQCEDAVEFEPVRLVAEIERRGQIVLNQLPLIDDDDPDVEAATA